MMTSMDFYRRLAKKRYDDLTPAEQKVVRLGGVAIACQSMMAQYQQLGQAEDYQTMEILLRDFLAKLQSAVANLPEDRTL
jgi:hypothetical protein